MAGKDQIMSVSITLTVAGEAAPQLKERIRQEAMGRGMSISEFIVMAIAEFLRKEKQ